MSYCLAAGNFLNGSSNRAGIILLIILDSYGFRLFDLEKVIEIKSNDNKKTLLMFVVEEIKK